MSIVDASQQLAQVLRNLDPAIPPRCADDAVAVDHVPGAFVVRGLMSSNECKLLSEAVQHLTNEALEVYPHAALGRGTDPTAVTRRRNSQHHTPCQVAPEDLAVLAARLRSCLPSQAGPKNLSKLQAAGAEVSGFLRCYYYQTGDASAPHYDRSFRQHEGDVETHFSAYSLLLYLNDDFSGGHTTFLATAGDGSKRSRNGATRVKASRPLDETAAEATEAATDEATSSTAPVAATGALATVAAAATAGIGSVQSTDPNASAATGAPGVSSSPLLSEAGAAASAQPFVIEKQTTTALRDGAAAEDTKSSTLPVVGGGAGRSSGTTTSQSFFTSNSTSSSSTSLKSTAAARVDTSSHRSSNSNSSSSSGGGDCEELAAQRNSLAHTHTKVTSVAPRMGDALIFPHGRTPGCFPDPLHEGSEVTSGAKALIRSDIIFTHPPPRNKRKKP